MIRRCGTIKRERCGPIEEKKSPALALRCELVCGLRPAVGALGLGLAPPPTTHSCRKSAQAAGQGKGRKGEERGQERKCDAAGKGGGAVLTLK